MVSRRLHRRPRRRRRRETEGPACDAAGGRSAEVAGEAGGEGRGKPAEKPAEKAMVPPVPEKAGRAGGSREARRPGCYEARGPAKPTKTEDNPFGKNDVRGLRMWTDISGAYRLEARLLSFEDGVVRLGDQRRPRVPHCGGEAQRRRSAVDSRPGAVVGCGVVT